MSAQPLRPEEGALPCTWQASDVCADCQIASDLQCRFERKDLTRFLLSFLPYGVSVVAGLLLAGFGWVLLGWVAFALFFFFVWEARVLCSHCPFWAEDSRVLHCHANYGVIKLWRYRPGPMSRAEQVQFLVGALLLIALPFPFMLAGGLRGTGASLGPIDLALLLAAVALASAVGFAVDLSRQVCTRCVNFSCPLNRVPKAAVDAYLRRNPVILEAWQASGYQLD